MANSNHKRAFIEVTALAAMLFIVPLGYYYGREHVLGFQNRIYYALFGIKQDHLEQFKRKQEEIRKKDEEAAKLALGSEKKTVGEEDKAEANVETPKTV